MIATDVILPDWTWEFHGHRCPFMPIGYRMGLAAMRELGVGRAKDHGVFALVEIGVGHPQTCMADGVMSATGCTYGKLMMERLGYGKMAMVLFAPGKRAVRVYLRSDFQDELGKQEFFSYRKRGVEPSDIPVGVTQRAVEAVLGATEEQMFKVERLQDFAFGRPRGSFAKVKCTRCGEYVFERYARSVDGKTLCIPCSGYAESRLDPLKGIQ
ncbi:MAG: TraR/DksA C4-type zinc finger protein [Nitrososphaerota archaeon]|nr:TraR/DksA C4-type zinc finger protein [Nitrososphaerota archaeon]MDG7024917.1 TraR/DksA C4-type zinc finger protein [Nitrososphaerota archaeon]